MFEILVGTACLLLLVTAVVHSWGGETFLLRPMFRARGNRVLESALARTVLRLAWHVTSLGWLSLALMLYATVFSARPSVIALWTVGASFTAAGLIDLVASKGRHIGWPLLTLVGLVAFAALAIQP